MPITPKTWSFAETQVSTLRSSLMRATGGEHERPDRKALILLGGCETETDSLTFATLHGAALGVADLLRPLDVAGSPVLILPRSAIDFAVVLLGCLYAGAIAALRLGIAQPRMGRVAAIAADLPASGGTGTRRGRDLHVYRTSPARPPVLLRMVAPCSNTRPVPWARPKAS
jgi:hypothetical protein